MYRIWPVGVLVSFCFVSLDPEELDVFAVQEIPRPWFPTKWFKWRTRSAPCVLYCISIVL